MLYGLFISKILTLKTPYELGWREDSNNLYFNVTLGWRGGHLNVMKFLCCFPLNFPVFTLSVGKKKTRLTPIFKSKQLRIKISCSQQETMQSQQTQRQMLCLEMGEGKRKEGKSKEGTSFLLFDCTIEEKSE